MSSEFPPCPASLRAIQHYLKTASEHESRDIVLVYWCRLYALQSGLIIDKKSDEAKLLLVKLMDWLEKKKREHSDNEAITNEVAAQAHIENYALKLFLWADNQDQSGIFNKNVVKSFYTAGMLMDVLTVFGELSEDFLNKQKYAKWKAAYIHNCLKSGETPIPGPPVGFEDPDQGIVEDFQQPGPTPGNDGSSEDFAGASNFIPSVPPSVPQAPSAFPSSTSDLLPASSQSYQPSVVTPQPSQHQTPSGVKLEAHQVTKAQKYCKFASSALNYDDIPEAISNLQKALTLLTTGEDG